jgi:hypothetical protein
MWFKMIEPKKTSLWVYWYTSFEPALWRGHHSGLSMVGGEDFENVDVRKCGIVSILVSRGPRPAVV